MYLIKKSTIFDKNIKSEIWKLKFSEKDKFDEKVKFDKNVKFEKKVSNLLKKTLSTIFWDTLQKLFSSQMKGSEIF